LADCWAVPHADADDYFWMPTSQPFVRKRPEDQRVALMHQMFVPRDAWVLSGSMLGWGDEIIAACDAVVFLTLDPVERLRRLEEREMRRRARRDFDEQAWAEFMTWARGYDDPAFTGRSRVAPETWLSTLRLPVLRLDSAGSRGQLLETVLRWEPNADQPLGCPCHRSNSTAQAAHASGIQEAAAFSMVP
jgi:hypothetical protein